MSYYDYENYYDPSVMDEILTDFQSKCKEVLLEDANSRIGTIVKQNEYYKAENEKLNTQVENLTKQSIDYQSELAQASVMSMLMRNLKELIKCDDKKEEKIYDLLSLVFKQDYNESTHDAPLWICALTQYYSNKNDVLRLLQALDVKLPNGVDNFRLPLDWNEEELDVFFDTVRNHYNCNGCTYKDNLRFWGSRSLKSVREQCNSSYSEIPWQYVLRNPLLKQEKYLMAIGQNAFKSHWNYFYKIDMYLDLTEQEIKVILNNFDYTKLTKSGEVAEFVLRNIKHIEDRGFLNKIYALFHDSYDFTYRKRILDMPYQYIKKWVSAHVNEAIKFIKENKDSFTNEQRAELSTIAIDWLLLS